MKVSAFSKTYEDVVVLDFPGMELQSGKIYAVIGANGSGKSTFARILTGVLKADRRETHLDTESIGYMPHGTDVGKAEALMDALRIRHLEQKRADKLSGGETARMALARLMMNRYDLVILDEPTAAMDMETTLLAEQLIAEYVRETGCAMILVTHSLQQARRIADEVLYFHKGRLKESGPRETVLYQPRMEETRQFLDFYGV